MATEKWLDFIGDINLGRNNLGEEMPVAVYRLFEFTMKDTLTKLYGKEQSTQILKMAGKQAGYYFSEQLLDRTLDFDSFIAQLQGLLKQLKIGILRIEEINDKASHLIVSISEDLDCSGLPVIGETVCHYDEGFLAGVLKSYTNQDYEVIEVDCWAKGGRVCRFEAKKA